MPDERSLVQKLRTMADQSASPQEAEVARAMLARLAATAPRIETRPVLTRESILGASDDFPRTGGSRREVLFQSPSGRWIWCYYDEVPWSVVKQFGLAWRFA